MSVYVLYAHAGNVAIGCTTLENSTGSVQQMSQKKGGRTALAIESMDKLLDQTEHFQNDSEEAARQVVITFKVQSFPLCYE
jgi:hypothetical protein